MDESEPHPTYDFFAPEPLPGYVGNLNNNNGWIEADVPLLGELVVVADKPMVGPLVDEIAEPIVEAEENDDSEGFDDKEVWEVNEEWLMAPVTPPPMSAVPPPSVYELVKKVIQVSDVEVADGITIGEIGLRISVVEGHVQVMASQMVYAADRFKQAAVQQRDSQIQQLQTTVFKMSSRESTLMQCILGMDRRLAKLERRPPGPQ
ncbi:hypothetical protein Tco_0842108 [Tanacetum coccineum]|uniref:Uncharacterized protein n=1 Tax=Tanacetum coccineum TaxID=301880 RepID=A0ABQ5AZ98_9ASTR